MSQETCPENAPPSRRLAKSERRRWVRYGASLEVSLRRFGARDDSWWKGELRDVSAAGAGLVSEAIVLPGTLLELRPRERAGAGGPRLTVRVRKSMELPNGGGWLLGCTFVRELSDEELQELV